MILRGVWSEGAVCILLVGTSRLLISNFVFMIGFYSAMDVDFSGDDSDGPEAEETQDSVADKFKELSDKQLDDEIKKVKSYANGMKTRIMNLPDKGAKFTILLHNLEKEKEARQIKKSLVTGGLSTDTLLHSPTDSSPLEDFKSPLHNGNFTVSSEISSQSPSPERGTSSVDRTPVAPEKSPGEQAGSSRDNLWTPNQFDQSEICSICKKISSLSTVRGKEGLFCSVCRRKARTPDPTFHLDSDLKTPAAKTTARKRARERDIVGRTPDTAMEIDSSDEDEKAQEGLGSALRGSSSEVSRRMGLRSTSRRRLEGYKVAFPSRTDPDAVEILPSDLQRLDPMEFLNDTVIDFYITYIQTDEFLDSEGRQRFHFFNSFFYKKLSEVVSTQKRKGGADFSRLRKWTKGTNIFEKDYLFVPIHDMLHWSLAIICFPGSDKGGDSERCIIHLDSMSHGHDSQRVFRLLRSYLVAEWKHSVEAGESEADECMHTVQRLKADSIPIKKVPAPLQDNESDCGLFLLHYIRKFVENAPKTMKVSDLEGNWSDLGVFGRKWFHSTEASSLRTSIQEQLHRLFDQEIQHQAEISRQSLSNDGTRGVCEVVIPLYGEAARK